MAAAAVKDVHLPLYDFKVVFPHTKFTNIDRSLQQSYSPPWANSSTQYRVTKPIVPFYFPSLVGDDNNKPTLIADAKLQVPADQYGTGVHWKAGQCSQTFSTKRRPHLDFKMSSAAGTRHQSLYMENGSGVFTLDLTFHGGAFGMWLSSQQFTIRNVEITNAVSAIYQEQNWGFTRQNIQISCEQLCTLHMSATTDKRHGNCQVGFELNTGGLSLANQSAGGVLIVNSKIANTGIRIRVFSSGFLSVFSRFTFNDQMSSTQPASLGDSVVLDNVAFSGITTANIKDSSGTVLAASAATVPHWLPGNVYLSLSSVTYQLCPYIFLMLPGTDSTKCYLRGTYTPSGSRPTSLIDSTGVLFSRSRPQYQIYTDIRRS
ncbi:hypothetical protein B0H14DRAFT_2590607 [Mycena olivaceomarginata]|nr:hypothetical protein B0H14DRAFT_2590607 [Mycena olivaceomarginata]